ncbi:hypothetical protein OED52_06945 [Rhodococcus sp. Z13]|uniref:Uncharacterized protein n=1 Tax=Rhodococcus sacchari TaxID=2962047 RepID=A0ACD4DJM8_9NOCA|nr:hypothetical protein [Rhodococcus sp. Z13]UYP20264.1 hypothetical protein OED52_06945 [Rhodococcus sp. Z13]
MVEASADGTPASPESKGTLSSVASNILDGPLTGLAPWIFLAVFEGPGDIGWVSGVALAISVFFLVADRLRGKTFKLFGAMDVVFFLGLFVVQFMLDADGQVWLEKWIGEIANITLFVLAAGSILIRIPFTLQYARDEVEPEYWHAPLFLRINYVITAAWALAFLVAAIAGWYGDAILDDSDNIWTGWVIQLAAMIAAIRFTAWYPDHAKAKAEADEARDQMR